MPLALVTGDDAVAAEALALIPGIHTAQVKEAVSRYSAVFNSHSENLKLLEAAGREATQKKYWQLYKVSQPVAIEITMFDPAMADAAELLPQVKRLSPRTIVIESHDYSQAFRLMLAVGALGASRKDPHFS